MFLYGRATRKLKSSTQCITDHMDYNGKVLGLRSAGPVYFCIAL